MSLNLIDPDKTIVVLAEADYAFQRCLSRYHYVAENPPTFAQVGDFIDAFQSAVIDAIKTIQHTGHIWRLITAQTLSGSVLRQKVISVPGNAGGEGMPPFVCFRLRFVRSVAGVRGGYKRYSGVSETNSGSGGFVTGIPVTQLEAIASAHVAPIVAGGNTYTPAIVVTTYNGQPLPVPRYWVPIGAQFSALFGSQNTRKP